jgi:putative FmdB family regulatory protein
MPVFEYKCRQCGHQFEYLLLHSSPAVECPACQKHDLEQLISLCAISSEATRRANLSAAHVKAAAVRSEKRHQMHADLHEHFEDRSSAAQHTDATHHED